jgi:hypothetical protein
MALVSLSSIDFYPRNCVLIPSVTLWRFARTSIFRHGNRSIPQAGCLVEHPGRKRFGRNKGVTTSIVGVTQTGVVLTESLGLILRWNPIGVVNAATGVVGGLFVNIPSPSREFSLSTIIFLSAYGYECDDIVFV